MPTRIEYILTEKNDEGLTVLALPRFRNSWMQKYLMPKRVSPYVRVTLEEHGTAVWEFIDGKRTVREIINELATHFGNETDYENRVITYITQLRKDGLIKYLI
ncbi:PqqD family protein [Bacteroides sp. 214]|uniref:PqqD family protein n=1 Tax=Bacteroides sp. 214 TaxID=2302935 RepID=UPI0013D76415|nr:PqqD family protein [Bacteroides sp. 214]NDW13362.1 PqqD family protein [Bacteroides sp. 214]